MAKRKPDTQLTHDNWNVDDYDEPEDAGVFQKASAEALKGRVFKQAKRRIASAASSNSVASKLESNSEPKSIFSGFAGFTSQPQSKKFAFSTNIGDAVSSATTLLKAPGAPTFASKTTTTTTTTTNGSIGTANQQQQRPPPTPKFSFTSNEVAVATKTNCDTKNTFKFLDKDDKQSDVSKSSNAFLSSSSSSTLPSSLVASKSFNGVDVEKKSPLPTTTMTSTSKLNELSAELRKNASPTTKSTDQEPKTADDIFSQKLRSLNLLCAEWIIKHLNENLSYILTPIFQDYEKYLNKLKDERQRSLSSSTSTKKAKFESTTTTTSSSSFASVRNNLGEGPSAFVSSSPFPQFSTITGTTTMAAITTSTTTIAAAVAATTTTTATSSSVFKTPSDFSRSSPSSSSKFNLISNVSPQTKASFAFPSPSLSPSSLSSQGTPNFKFTAPVNNSSNSPQSKADEAANSSSSSGSDSAVGGGSSGGFFKFAAQPKVDSSIGAGGGATTAAAPKSTQSTMFSFGFNAAASAAAAGGTGNTPPAVFNPFLGINNAATTTTSSSSSSSMFAPPPHLLTNNDGGDGGKGDEDETQPPPVVDETITEEGSVYEKKCKVFVKKDGTFVDHGVGFLFLKLIGDEKKCQLIVRANNKLATIILNVLLSANVPVQPMGANNVMIICCPTPEAKPSTVLLKVKTAKDAEELLNKLKELRK